MRQRPITIVVETEPSDALAAQVREWNRELRAPSSLHFMSCVIASGTRSPSHARDDPDGRNLPGALILEATFDGRRHGFVRALVEKNWDQMQRLYASAGHACSNRDQLISLLLENDVGADLFYQAYPGRGVDQIQREQHLHAALRAALPGTRAIPDLERPQTTLAIELRERLQQAAQKAVSDVAWLRTAPKRAFWVRNSLRWVSPWILAGPLGLALLLMILLGPAPGLLVASALTVSVPTGLAGAFCIGLENVPWVSLLPWFVAATMGLCLLWTRQTGSLAIGLKRASLAALILVVFTAISAGVAAAFSIRPWAAAMWLGAGLLGVLLALLAAAGFVLGKLVVSEAEETSWPMARAPLRAEPGNRSEDRHTQNHFASITLIKPGWFRRNLLRSVLRILNLLCRVLFATGDLGGVRSIHSARFVILPDGERLLFSGHYDGSWSSYLTDFSCMAGLTAIWGNTGLWGESGQFKGFPRPRLLIFGGGRDEQRFKNYALFSWTESLLRYSAYPDLSVAHVERNAEVHAGLFATIDNTDMSELGRWLARI